MLRRSRIYIEEFAKRIEKEAKFSIKNDRGYCTKRGLLRGFRHLSKSEKNR